MRTTLFACTVLAGAALLAVGCAGPEAKLGRGLNNVTEITRWGEFSRSVEQASIYNGPDAGGSTGVIHGFNRTMGRTLVGVYEVVTFPLPSYDPIMYPEYSVYPDSYHRGMFHDTMTSPDANLGFSGGDEFPLVPGSRFHVFDN